VAGTAASSVANAASASPRSIAQALSARIRDHILNGAFTAGEHLREVQLAAMFGASRTPVRLALAANEKDGLLDYTAHRGYVVRPFDLTDIASAFEMRALIEGFACRQAAEQGLHPDRQHQAQAAIDAVAALLHRKEALDEQCRSDWRAHNSAFHRAIVEQSGNRFIGPMLANVQQIPSVYPPIMASYDPQALRIYNDQHRAVLACILQRQGTRAEFLMREHVSLAGETICAALGTATSAGQAG